MGADLFFNVPFGSEFPAIPEAFFDPALVFPSWPSIPSLVVNQVFLMISTSQYLPDTYEN